MLAGTIRPLETRTADVEGVSLEDVHDQLVALTPAGFDLVKAPVEMLKGSTTIRATGTFERRDGTREIEADDLATLKAKVPEGWQLLHVRRL